MDKTMQEIESTPVPGKHVLEVYDDMLVYGYNELCKARRSDVGRKEMFDIMERIMQIVDRREQYLTQMEYNNA